MDQSSHAEDMVLRAAFQISCGTNEPVEYDRMKDVVPITKDELRPIVAQLQSRGLFAAAPDDAAVMLTPRGIDLAAKLPPMSEPPLMIDA